MGLNIANLDTLIAKLETVPVVRFNMWDYYTSSRKVSAKTTNEHDCGTAACIAGWIGWISGITSQHLTMKKAAGWIGLSGDLANQLFTPWTAYARPELYPLARALDVLRHLRTTGEVDWDRFPYENYVKPKAAWTPPVVIEVVPDLPDSLTSLLRPTERVPA